jgi:hypothetical protein
LKQALGAVHRLQWPVSLEMVVRIDEVVDLAVRRALASKVATPAD